MHKAKRVFLGNPEKNLVHEVRRDFCEAKVCFANIRRSKSLNICGHKMLLSYFLKKSSLYDSTGEDKRRNNGFD